MLGKEQGGRDEGRGSGRAGSAEGAGAGAGWKAGCRQAQARYRGALLKRLCGAAAAPRSSRVYVPFRLEHFTVLTSSQVEFEKGTHTHTHTYTLWHCRLHCGGVVARCR